MHGGHTFHLTGGFEAGCARLIYEARSVRVKLISNKGFRVQGLTASATQAFNPNQAAKRSCADENPSRT